MDELDKKIINYLFNMISRAIVKKESWGFSEYGFNNENYVLKVNTNDWAPLFNFIFNETLKNVDRFTNIFTYGRGMLGPNERSQVIHFWEFYDKLLKLGFGYYIPWITRKGKTFLHFKIFNKLYEDRNDFFTFLKEIPNLEDQLENGQKFGEREELEKSWSDDAFNY